MKIVRGYTPGSINNAIESSELSVMDTACDAALSTAPQTVSAETLRTLAKKITVEAAAPWK